MNITIKDKVGLSPEEVMRLVLSLLQNRKPKGDSFNYGLETHGRPFGIGDPIKVSQANERASTKSPIVIEIEKRTDYS